MTTKRFSERLLQALDDTCHVWRREIRRMFHDEGVVIFVVIVPLLYPLLYSWIYTNEVVREVPVAIVDHSHSHKSRQFAHDIDATPDVDVAYHCADMPEAQRLMAEQEVKGILYFPQDFSQKINRGEQAHVGVYCDMSLMLTYKAIYMSALAVSMNMSTDIQVTQAGGVTDQDDKINADPVQIDEISLYNATGGYGNFLIPAVLVLIIQQTLMLGIGLSAGTAREQHANKLLIPMDSRYNATLPILLGKALCYVMLYAMLGTYLLLAVPRFFGFTSLLTAQTIFGFLLPYMLACVFFSMALSCLVRYRESVFLLVVFTSVPFLFLSGVSWPKECIPPFWESISYLFPSTFGIRGFVRINGMGASLRDIEFEYMSLWAQAVIYFVITYFEFRYQLRLTRKSAS